MGPTRIWNTGVVHRNRDHADLLAGTGHPGDDAVSIGDVHLYRIAAPAGLLDDLAQSSQPLHTAPCGHHGGSCRSENLGETPPEPRCTAGDERHLAAEVAARVRQRITGHDAAAGVRVSTPERSMRPAVAPVKVPSAFTTRRPATKTASMPSAVPYRRPAPAGRS